MAVSDWPSTLLEPTTLDSSSSRSSAARVMR
jgi:hypothetical protein